MEGLNLNFDERNGKSVAPSAGNSNRHTGDPLGKLVDKFVGSIWTTMQQPAEKGYIGSIIVGNIYQHLIENKIVSNRSPSFSFDKGPVSEQYLAGKFNMLHTGTVFDRFDPIYTYREAFGEYQVSKLTLLRKFVYLLSYEDADWLTPGTFHTIPPESDSVLNAVREVLVKDGDHESFLFLVDGAKPNLHGFACLYVQSY